MHFHLNTYCDWISFLLLIVISECCYSAQGLASSCKNIYTREPMQLKYDPTQFISIQHDRTGFNSCFFSSYCDLTKFSLRFTHFRKMSEHIHLRLINMVKSASACICKVYINREIYGGAGTPTVLTSTNDPFNGNE